MVKTVTDIVGAILCNLIMTAIFGSAIFAVYYAYKKSKKEQLDKKAIIKIYLITFVVIGGILLVATTVQPDRAANLMVTAVMIGFLVLFLKFRNKSSNNKQGYLIQSLDNKGEKLIAENIHGDKIIVKLKGNFGQGLVITDKRLYIVKWGWMTGNTWGGNCTAFEYRNIVGFEIKKSLGSAFCQILTPSNQETQKSYWGKGSNDAIKSDNTVTFRPSDAKLFQEAIRIGRDFLQNSHGHNSQPVSSYSDLEKLAEFKDKGIITKEEFEAKKKVILGL